MLTIYGRPDEYTPKCYQCISVKKWLDRNGISYQYKDVEDNMELLSDLGIRTLPVVVMPDGSAFGGFDIGKLQEIKNGS